MGKVEAANVPPSAILGQTRGSARTLADQLSLSPLCHEVEDMSGTVPSIGKNSKQPVPRDSGA